MKRRLLEKIKEVNDEKLLRQIDDSLLGASVRDEISLYKRQIDLERKGKTEPLTSNVAILENMEQEDLDDEIEELVLDEEYDPEANLKLTKEALLALPLESNLDIDIPSNLQSPQAPKSVLGTKEKIYQSTLNLKRTNLTLEKQLEQERQARMLLELEVESLRRRSMFAQQFQNQKVQTPLQLHTARLLAGETLQIVRKQEPCYY